VGHFERKFQGERGVPTNDFWHQKVESLGYRMVKKIAEKFNCLRRVHQRHRQTDGSAMAIANVTYTFTFAKNEEWLLQGRTVRLASWPHSFWNMSSEQVRSQLVIKSYVKLGSISVSGLYIERL